MPNQRDIKIKIRLDATSFSGTLQDLNYIKSNPAVIRQRLKRAVLLSVVRNMRRRFLLNAEAALEMETQPRKKLRDEQEKQSAKTRFRDTRTKAALNAEFDALSDAQGSGLDSKVQELRDRAQRLYAKLSSSGSPAGDLSARARYFDAVDQAGGIGSERARAGNRGELLSAILKNRRETRNELASVNSRIAEMSDTNVIRKKIEKLQSRLAESQGRDASGRRITPHALTQVRGEGQFRLNMSRLLNLFVDSSLAETFDVRSGFGVGIGPTAAIESIRTPSSTQALTGTPTRSRYQTFWRHLEFGTGVYRKTGGNPAAPRGSTDGSPAPWYYGNDKRGIVAIGSRPMNFITDKNNVAYASDETDLLEEITAMLDGLFKR